MFIPIITPFFHVSLHACTPGPITPPPYSLSVYCSSHHHLLICMSLSCFLSLFKCKGFTRVYTVSYFVCPFIYENVNKGCCGLSSLYFPLLTLSACFDSSIKSFGCPLTLTPLMQPIQPSVTCIRFSCISMPLYNIHKKGIKCNCMDIE